MENGGTSSVGLAPNPAPGMPSTLRRVLFGGVPVRWVLLLAVLAGVFGLHVLTVEHGDHGDLPSSAILIGPSESGPTAQVDAMPPGGGTRAYGHDAPALPADTGHGGLTGCVLFLAVAAAAAVLLANALRRRGDPTPTRGMLLAGGPQRPVPGVPRLVLCTLRV